MNTEDLSAFVGRIWAFVGFGLSLSWGGFGFSWGRFGKGRAFVSFRVTEFGLSWGEIRAFVKLAGFPVEDLGLSIRGEHSAVCAEDLRFREDSVLAFVGCSWGGFWAFVGRVSDFAWEDFGLSCGRFGLSWGGKLH